MWRVSRVLGEANQHTQSRYKLFFTNGYAKKRYIPLILLNQVKSTSKPSISISKISVSVQPWANAWGSSGKFRRPPQLRCSCPNSGGSFKAFFFGSIAGLITLASGRHSFLLSHNLCRVPQGDRPGLSHACKPPNHPQILENSSFPSALFLSALSLQTLACFLSPQPSANPSRNLDFPLTTFISLLPCKWLWGNGN